MGLRGAVCAMRPPGGVGGSSAGTGLAPQEELSSCEQEVPEGKAGLPTPGCSRPKSPSALGGHSRMSILSPEPTSHRDRLPPCGDRPSGRALGSQTPPELPPSKPSRLTHGTCDSPLLRHPASRLQGRPLPSPHSRPAPSLDDCPGPWRAALCPHPPARGHRPPYGCPSPARQVQGPGWQEGGSGQPGLPKCCRRLRPEALGTAPGSHLLGWAQAPRGPTAVTVTSMARARASLGARPGRDLVPQPREGQAPPRQPLSDGGGRGG